MAGNSHRILLLAEDDVLVRNLVRHALERAGFLVFAAANGFEALELSRAIPGRIDVLVTELDMPQMSGVSLAWHISGERPDTLIVVISGRISHVIEKREMVFLPKTREPAIMLRTLEELLDTNRRRGSLHQGVFR